MKLNRDNFIKQSYDGGMLYQYVCNDTNFFLFVKGQGSAKNIKIFKGNVDAQVDTFETKDTLEAWNKFEEMLTECQPKQTSSGGFKNNPQQNPNILPLLAIRKGTSGWDVILFVEYQNDQIDVMNFQLTESALPNPLPEDLTIVNWTNEEIPTILKCEVIIKKINKKFEANPSDDVFLFIPKSIVEQGGEEGGNTEGGEDGGDQQGKEGKGKKGKKDGQNKTDGGLKGDDGEDDEPSDEEPTDEEDAENQTDGGLKGGDEKDGEPSDEEPSDEEDGENQTDGGLEGGEEEESQKEEESNRLKEVDNNPKEDDTEDSKQKNNQPTMTKGFSNFSEAITKLSEISGVQPSTLLNVFRTPTLGETWLLTNNFPKIKNELNLPQNMTALELSKSIINSK